MEWIILCLSVPAILVPVVLLWGFAGCSFHGAAVASTPSAPADLTVDLPETTTGALTLSWLKTDFATTGYQIERAIEGGNFETIGSTAIGDPTPQTFKDLNVQEEISYIYQVRTKGDGGMLSDPSVPQVAAIANVFTAALGNNQPDAQDEPDADGNTLVQRIPRAHLQSRGAQLRITVRGSTTDALTIDRIYISQAAPAGASGNPTPDPWDSAADLTKVFDVSDGGVPPLALTPPVAADPDRNAATLKPIKYALDSSKDLIVAFDINPVRFFGNVRFAPLSGAEAYFKAPELTGDSILEAKVTDRTPKSGDPNFPPPYDVHTADAVYLVEKIVALRLGIGF